MRRAKQLIYGIFYLAVWAGLIGGIYAWQKPVASCFDNKQNQKEAGVDCGGPCARVCIPATIAPLAAAGDPKLIVFGGSQAASSTGTPGPASAPRVSLVAEIQNRNIDFGASSFDYVFSVYDRTGAVLASFPGRSFIYPAEIKRLAILNEGMPADSEPVSAKITLSGALWTPAVRFPRPQLTLQAAGTQEANGNFVTQGTVVNQDSVDFPVVYLTALYYDADGKVVGVSGTERNNVTAGETREFALFHPVIPGAVLARTQVSVTAYNLR